MIRWATGAETERFLHRMQEAARTSEDPVQLAEGLRRRLDCCPRIASVSVRAHCVSVA
jgi:hypothetical protein